MSRIKTNFDIEEIPSHAFVWTLFESCCMLIVQDGGVFCPYKKSHHNFKLCIVNQMNMHPIEEPHESHIALLTHLTKDKPLVSILSWILWILNLLDMLWIITIKLWKNIWCSMLNNGSANLHVESNDTHCKSVHSFKR